MLGVHSWRVGDASSEGWDSLGYVLAGVPGAQFGAWQSEGVSQC